MRKTLLSLSALALALVLGASPAMAQSLAVEAASSSETTFNSGGVDILHEQIDGTQTTGILSQNNATNTDSDAELADDFMVPADVEWLVSRVWARAFYSGGAAEGDCATAHVTFYEDFGGRPGGLIETQGVAPAEDDGGILTIDINPVQLEEGHYWFSVVCEGPLIDVGVTGRWNWFLNDTEANFHPAHLRAPNGGFGPDLKDWTALPDAGDFPPDLDWYIAGAEEPVVSNEGGAQPQIFSLLQNAPNPFSGSTDISFVLDESAEVTVTVFDALGRVVGQPFAGELPAGEQTVVFDASNLTAGTYFYRLQTGSQFMVRKMTVVN